MTTAERATPPSTDRSRGGLTRLIALMVSLTMLGLVGVGAATAKPRPPQDPTAVPVTGTLADGTGAVTGTFDVSRFVSQGGQLLAVGTFDGTIVDDEGALLKSGTQQIAVPVDLAETAGSCQVLDLVLGPLDLDLLGLQVSLNQIELNITAQSGPGNLLGNLLCAVAGLLDGNTGLSAVLDQIARLLNQILGALG